MLSIRSCSLIALALLTSCETAPDESRSVIVSDSAGVRVVENRESQWGAGEAWTLSDGPVLEIGVVEGERPYMLSGVTGVRRLADRSIALTDMATSEIRIFDREGRHMRSIGGRGLGPGQFQTPWGLTVMPGDSIFVWDLEARRATVYSLGGELGRVFSLEERAAEFGRPDYFRRLPNGDLLTLATTSVEQMMATQVGPRSSMWVVVRYSAEGTNPRVLGKVEQLPCDPKKDGECSFIAYGGRGSIATHEDRVYTSHPYRNEIQILDTDGRLLSRIRGATPPQPVTETMKEEFTDAVVAADPERAADRRAYVAQASFSDVVPAFSGLIVSMDGYVWARDYRVEEASFGYRPLFPPPSGPRRYTVFDPEGVELGEVEVPQEFTIAEIGDDYVLGVGRDELGVERVQMYSLVKPQG